MLAWILAMALYQFCLSVNVRHKLVFHWNSWTNQADLVVEAYFELSYVVL